MKKILTFTFAFLLIGFISAQEYTLKGKLICEKEVCQLTPNCGIYAFAKAFKFEIISCNYQTESKYLVAIVECPELKGENFFLNGSTYELKLIPKSTASFSWSIDNEYEGRNLPTLWVKEITKSFN